MKERPMVFVTKKANPDCLGDGRSKGHAGLRKLSMSAEMGTNDTLEGSPRFKEPPISTQ